MRCYCSNFKFHHMHCFSLPRRIIRLRVLLNRKVTFDGPVPLSNHVNISLVSGRIGKDLQVFVIDGITGVCI